MLKHFMAIGAVLLLGACAEVQVTRTSANTFMLDASADPSCGSRGAARVASTSAAIETLRAGYDRYVITNGYSQNNVHQTQLPGRYETTGKYSSHGVYKVTQTYVPGNTVTSGSYDQSLSVMMFRRGDPGYEDAIDARSALGPDWQRLVREGVHQCS